MDVLGHLSDEWKKNKGKHKFRRAVGYATENRKPTIRVAEFLGRDRDPPSFYDDDNPEVTFRQYEKLVELWLLETEVNRAKRGIKLLRQLSGVAVNDMEVKEIASENGVENILHRFRDYFAPHLEVSFLRAFEIAIYGP